ncbi:MAG: polysialic acid transporter [Methylococcaceae bacterium]|nr:MAG: polysialic acid transporter [Methylococcaceae bacterium]
MQQSYAPGYPQTAPTYATAAGGYRPITPSRMFGAQLFNGNFGGLTGGGFNPDYQVNVGDSVQLQMWGSFNYSGQAVVDPQGNIFVPNVGPVPVAGVPNAQLNRLVEDQVRRVYKANVGVYVSLDISQPVKVFVTGYVRQPGLYGGVASESLLSYLDRAGGVDPDRGSYVDVTINRGGVIRKKVNLYDFLLHGRLDYIQLQNGDAIVVGPRKYTFSVSGEAYNPYDFEFERPEIPLQKALDVAKPKPGATHVSVIRRQGDSSRSEYFALDQIAGVILQDGDAISLTSDRYAGTIQVRVEGAHSGEHALVLPYGSTMKEVLERVKPNALSRIDAIQCFRKSVALRQKEMLNVSLNKLEEAAYSARSETIEEANLRTAEAQLISKFVEKARLIEPKGQVVLDQAALESTILEDGDVIRIPEHSSLVMVHGEVLLPNAVSWREGLDADDYIDQVGGYTQSADTSKIIVIHQNGEALAANDAGDLLEGDEIMVLPRIDTKNIEIARALGTIIYQIAVASRFAMMLF